MPDPAAKPLARYAAWHRRGDFIFLSGCDRGRSRCGPDHPGLCGPAARDRPDHRSRPGNSV